MRSNTYLFGQYCAHLGYPKPGSNYLQVEGLFFALVVIHGNRRWIDLCKAGSLVVLSGHQYLRSKDLYHAWISESPDRKSPYLECQTNRLYVVSQNQWMKGEAWLLINCQILPLNNFFCFNIMKWVWEGFKWVDTTFLDLPFFIKIFPNWQ